MFSLFIFGCRCDLEASGLVHSSFFEVIIFAILIFYRTLLKDGFLLLHKCVSKKSEGSTGDIFLIGEK